MIVVVGIVKIVRHLGARVVIAALGVKRLVLRTAVENVLVAADVFSNGIKGLDHLEAQLLALVFFGDGDLFDMADESTVVDATSQYSTCKSKGILAFMSCTYNFLSTMSDPVPTMRSSCWMARR